MTREEWKTRCAARLISGGQAPAWANLRAGTLADEQAEQHGASRLAWEHPNEAAEKELAEELEDDR